MSDSEAETYASKTIEYTLERDLYLGNIQVNDPNESYIYNNGW